MAGTASRHLPLPTSHLWLAAQRCPPQGAVIPIVGEASGVCSKEISSTPWLCYF